MYEQLQFPDMPEARKEPIKLGKEFLTCSPLIRVQWISEEKGHGMFANVDIPSGTVVSVAPVLFVPDAELFTIGATSLNGYVFTWDDDYLVFPLGVAGLFNHDFTPNCEYEMWEVGDEDEDGFVFEFDCIRMITTSDVNKDEELTVSYMQGSPDTELWFDPA